MITTLAMNIFLCSSFTMINKTNDQWNFDDVKVIVNSSSRCYHRYKSCLKRFVKKGDKNYNAVCE